MVLWVATLLVLIGAALLCFGWMSARKICNYHKQRGWRSLQLLISAFIVGYISFIYFLHTQTIPSVVSFGISSILFGGSIFVVLVVNYSANTIKALKELADQETYNARHDYLTRLPNRKYCLELIDHRLSFETPFSVIIFDLVNFKQLNDGMGHFCGDELLVRVGKRFQRLLDENEFIARMGGDEFIVVTDKVKSNEIEDFLFHLDFSLTRPFNISGLDIHTSAVFGVCSFPSDAKHSELLLKNADMAMYQAKHAGKLFGFYEKHMHMGSKKNLTIASQIVPALEKQQLDLHYQPLISTVTSQVVGYEALLRWQMDDGDFIPPSEFIPIAEQGNKIRAVTAWVLERAIDDMKTFEQQGINLPIHINLSAKDLLSNQLIDALQLAIMKQPNIADRLILEITETTAINYITNPGQLLQKIKQLGFQISLDDFGTGYSSLSLLRDLPVDQIKIDRSFIERLVDDKGNSTIVENAIRLAHSLGYTVVAEGVEDQESFDFLLAKRCDYVQGYLFSPARKIEDAALWTLNHNAAGKVAG